jgi:hypothetical protein
MPADIRDSAHRDNRTASGNECKLVQFERLYFFDGDRCWLKVQDGDVSV